MADGPVARGEEDGRKKKKNIRTGKVRIDRDDLLLDCRFIWVWGVGLQY